MSTSVASNRSIRYVLIIFLIITLFLSALFFYARNNKADYLTNEINQLSKLKEDYAQIDSCIFVLYNADNNSRLYAITGEKKYIKDFFNDINYVSGIINKISSNPEINTSKNLKALVDQKIIQTNSYLKLRQLTDSLLAVNADFNTGKNIQKSKLANEVAYTPFKTIVTVDSIANIVEEKKEEKKFFGRLMQAFSKQKNKVKKADTTYSIVRTEVKLDTALQSKKFNQLQLKTLNTYYKNMYTANNLLRNNELIILKINNNIIKELVLILKNYKSKEKQFALENKMAIQSNIDETFQSFDHIYAISLGLLIFLVITIMYILWKIYRNENELIESSQKSSQYALSKSRFLTNMSHEIRTPLNSVVGFSEQLSQSNLTEEQSQQVSAIRSSSAMLLDVVNDILDFSKYEKGKVSFDKISFLPFDSINDVFNSIEIQAINKKIQFKKEVDFNSNLCFSGDSLRLKQVIMNLLSNAIKFTEKGSVSLKAEVIPISKKTSLLKIQVIDTGLGIANEDINMIFDEFAQVKYSSKKIKQKGTGLGLAICKKIVEHQGGKIEATSELGKGSIFSFEIPYDICTLESILESKNVNSVKVDGLQGKRILLADDNKMNILLAQTVLKKYSLEIDIAYDGKQAFILFENNEYNLILTDIQMPEMGGIELTRIIRASRDKSKNRVPILGVTANVLEEDRKKYIESGINELVLKPFSEKELMDKINQYIN